MATGAPAPVGTMVALSCYGGQPAETEIDQDGRFEFPLKQTRAAGRGTWTNERETQIAGRAGGDAQTGYTGCLVRVALSGYRAVRSPAGAGGSRRSGNFVRYVDLGTVVLYPLDDDQGVTVSLTSIEAPARAAKAYDKALKAMKRNPPDLDSAIASLRKATGAHPSYAAAWTTLGEALMLRKDFRSALRALTRAREADPLYTPLYPRLVGVTTELRDWAATIDGAETWRRLHPGVQAAEYYRAVASMHLGDLVVAEEAARALVAGPDLKKYPHALYFLGFIEAQRGEYASAAGHFRRLLEIWPEAPMAAEVHSRLNEWSAEGTIEPSPRNQLAAAGSR